MDPFSFLIIIHLDFGIYSVSHSRQTSHNQILKIFKHQLLEQLKLFVTKIQVHSFKPNRLLFAKLKLFTWQLNFSETEAELHETNSNVKSSSSLAENALNNIWLAYRSKKVSQDLVQDLLKLDNCKNKFDNLFALIDVNLCLSKLLVCDLNQTILSGSDKNPIKYAINSYKLLYKHSGSLLEASKHNKSNTFFLNASTDLFKYFAYRPDSDG